MHIDQMFDAKNDTAEVILIILIMHILTHVKHAIGGDLKKKPIYVSTFCKGQQLQQTVALRTCPAEQAGFLNVKSLFLEIFIHRMAKNDAWLLLECRLLECRLLEWYSGFISRKCSIFVENVLTAYCSNGV